MNRLARLASLALPFALLGCEPEYDHTTFSDTTTPPLAAAVSGSQITITLGAALRTVPKVFNDDNEEMEGTVSLTSGDTAIVAIYPALDAGFVLVGRSVGSTQVIVTLDGKEVERIPATVTAQ